MYFTTAVAGVRPVGFSTHPCPKARYTTPENRAAQLTQMAVQVPASLVVITCGFLLNTPRSSASAPMMKAMKAIHKTIS